MTIFISKVLLYRLIQRFFSWRYVFLLLLASPLATLQAQVIRQAASVNYAESHFARYWFSTASSSRKTKSPSVAASLVGAYIAAAGGVKSLVVGATLQFSAFGVYSDGTVTTLPDRETDRVIAWSTSNHIVAQVSLIGHVTAISAGTVNIGAVIGPIVATPWTLTVAAPAPPATGLAGGITSEGQYNDAGVLAGSSSLLFNTRTGALTNLTLTNPGTFGFDIYTSYLNSVVSGVSGSVGNCAFNSTWYQPITAAVYGCITAPVAASGNRNTAGGFFAAYTQDNRATSYMEPVGIIGEGIALANGGSVYGANLIAEDQINCCNSGLVLVGQENDIQPTSSSGPTAYLGGAGFRATIGFTNGNTGTYPFDGYQLSSNQAAAYWRAGFTSYVGALGPNSVLLNIGAQGLATSTSGNFNCPRFANIYEAYWNGTANQNEQWDFFCAINSGTTPSDYFKVANFGGAAGSSHFFDLTGGIQLELDGASSGSAFISVSATGGVLNLGSANATIDSQGNLTVTSCSGCSVNADHVGGTEARVAASSIGRQAISTDQGDGSSSRSAIVQQAVGDVFYSPAKESFTTTSVLTKTYTVVSMTSVSGRVQPAPPGATNNIGIAQGTSGANLSVNVISYGPSQVIFDNTPGVGDFACAPPEQGGMAGVAHDNGRNPCPASQRLGVVIGSVSEIGSGAAATVLLQIGN